MPCGIGFDRQGLLRSAAHQRGLQAEAGPSAWAQGDVPAQPGGGQAGVLRSPPPLFRRRAVLLGPSPAGLSPRRPSGHEVRVVEGGARGGAPRGAGAAEVAPRVDLGRDPGRGRLDALQPGPAAARLLPPCVGLQQPRPELFHPEGEGRRRAGSGGARGRGPAPLFSRPAPKGPVEPPARPPPFQTRLSREPSRWARCGGERGLGGARGGEVGVGLSIGSSAQPIAVTGGRGEPEPLCGFFASSS